MRARVGRFVAWGVLCGACGSAPLPSRVVEVNATPAVTRPRAQVGHPDPAFLEQLAATRNFRLGTPQSITLTADGSEVLFLRSGPRSFVQSLYAFTVATGEERVLLTTEQVLAGAEEELSAEERARRERQRVAARGLVSFELSDDGTKILVPLSGRIFVVDRATAEVNELESDAGPAIDPRFSPDGRYVACVRGADLYVLDVATGRERRLTRASAPHITNGVAEFVAQEEMDRDEGYWWAPDSASLVYQETDTSEVEQLHALDPMYPERAPGTSAYPRAGTPNAKVRLGVVSVTGGRTRWFEWDGERLPYLAHVVWSKNGPLTFVVQDRRQREERVLVAWGSSGETRTLLTEEDREWVNLDEGLPHRLESGYGFLWTTERGGAWQLEHRSASGDLVGTITTPEFGYAGLVHVDETTGVVWLLGGADPTETHVFRVPIGGGSPTQVTDGRGEHAAVVADKANVWVETAMLVTGEPKFVVHQGDRIAGELRSEAEQAPFVPNLEFITVGEHQLRAVVVRPREFDASALYPVLVSVYGGPHYRSVRATGSSYVLQQWVADHGYIVVAIDGRGTPRRGREWERAIAGNVIDKPMVDQIAGLRALAEQIPQMDLARVGIYGWSFGGYFAAMAVALHPDVFHAAIAGAPVTDWRDYDTHYTERYMGLPEENPEGYARTSVLTHAPNLERPLLIVHGTADDNVYFMHAIKLSDALLRAGKAHEFLPLSGFTHMVADPETTRALHTRMMDFFARNVQRR